MAEVLDQGWQRIAASAIAHAATMTAENIRFVAAAYDRPAAIFRPALSVDGNQWCALYGANLIEGVAGFGATPEAAMHDFDVQWRNAKATGSAA